MTPEQRAEALRQDRIIQRSFPALRARIAAEKNRYIRKCAESYRNTSQLRDDDFYEHEKKITDLLYAQYLRIGRAINGEVMKSFKRQRPNMEFKQESRFEYLLKRWARTEAGRKAKPIASTTQKDINRAVTIAYEKEEPENIVIRDILSTQGYSRFRADAIARTETHNAAMYSSRTTAEEFTKDEGVTMLKIWSPAIDDRSREYHVQMEDHPPIPMDGMFDVPSPDGGTDKMDRPGDPSAPPYQTINCRCGLTYEVV